MKKNEVNKKVLLELLFIILSIIFVVPILFHGYIFGDDIQFHFDRIYEISQNIKHFNLFPQFYSYSFGKIGYLLNSFYPWMTLLPFSILLNIIPNPLVAFCFGVAFYIFIGLNLTYLVFKKVPITKGQAFFTALIYMFSGYLSVNLYRRFALGEFLGMIFLPLAFYGLYAILFGNEKDWPYLAWGMSLIILSHLLTAYILSIVFCIILLFTFYQLDNKKEKIIEIGKSILLCIASTLIFIIPFLVQELGQKFLQPDPYQLQSGANDLFNSIVISLSNTPGLNDMQHIQCGVVVIGTLIVGVFFWKYFNKLERVSYVSAIFIYVCCNCAGLWQALNNTPLTLIQFPNRLLSLVTLFSSIVGGKILFIIFKKFNGKFKKLLPILGIIIVVAPWIDQVNKQLDFEKVAAAGHQMLTYQNDKFTDYGGYHFENYTPADAMQSLSFATCHQVEVDGNVIQLSQNEVISKPNCLEFKVTAKKDNLVKLPVLYYLNLHGYQGNKKLNLMKSSDGLVSVKAKMSDKPIFIEYIPSFIECLGIIISISTWLISMMVWIRNKKIKESEKNGKAKE